ncbi:DUF4235 domain-containing protein [Streptomyces mirabilis]|uniref:DUF4235 domain-containing protein n=1 Tax=Streptomyces mirabilis TaxID=68239 RepID=UPI003693C869
MKASKIAYKPVGLALGAVSGMVAGAAFKQAWKMLGHDEDATDATDEERKAAVDRAGATATRRLTGTWPG